MGFNCGIIGLPNVGKSTLFNALTGSKSALAENYPFCTIEPNIGRVPLYDERLVNISKIASSKNTIPTFIEFVDIAGLVKGASKGEGLGNKFLSKIRETDAICHVIRCFENDDISHVSGKIDPLRDLEIVETELMIADIESLERKKINVTKKARGQDKFAKKTLEVINTTIEKITKGTPARDISLEQEYMNVIKELNLLTYKPILYIANVSEEAVKLGNTDSKILEEYGVKRNIKTITLSIKLESEISEISETTERLKFINALGLSQSGLDKLSKAGYGLLNLITFFTTGIKETRAWTIMKGTKANIAAGRIHNDFSRGFIAAETISYEDYTLYNGEQNAKEAGKMRIEGKDYEVIDGDIILFRFNI